MNFSVNWFKYRLPNSTEIISGASHRLLEGFGKGFVLVPFRNKNKKAFTIPLDFNPAPEDIKPLSSYLPEFTPRTTYYEEIEAIKTSFHGAQGKTVAARVIKIDFNIDINATFAALCKDLPDAYIFAFSSSESGTWIGATPELLLRKDGDKLSTMALAGTRVAGFHGEWDIKNIEEQKMVTDFIVASLRNSCSHVSCSPTFTKRAGIIEHICTPITAQTVSDDDGQLQEILFNLSPTPAVCGSNRKLSLDIIERYEAFDRQFYGGFCGPNQINDITSFFVILRSAKCNENAVAVFAGGGITRLSDSYKEWNETEMKSKTIINNLKSTQE